MESELAENKATGSERVKLIEAFSRLSPFTVLALLLAGNLWFNGVNERTLMEKLAEQSAAQSRAFEEMNRTSADRTKAINRLAEAVEEGIRRP